MIKCPHCDKLLISVTITPIEGKMNGWRAPAYRCMAYSCPQLNCQKLIGIEASPFLIAEETAAALKKRLSL